VKLTTLPGLPGQFGDALLHSPLLDAYGVSIEFAHQGKKWTGGRLKGVAAATLEGK